MVQRSNSSPPAKKSVAHIRFSTPKIWHGSSLHMDFFVHVMQAEFLWADANAATLRENEFSICFSRRRLMASHRPVLWDRRQAWSCCRREVAKLVSPPKTQKSSTPTEFSSLPRHMKS